MTGLGLDGLGPALGCDVVFGEGSEVAGFSGLARVEGLGW